MYVVPGQAQLKTPNVDKLASEGLVFNAAYCQQAVCGPSRASFMSGRRPAHTNVFDNNANFRISGHDSNGDGADWVCPLKSLVPPFGAARLATCDGCHSLQNVSTLLMLHV